jgi:nucleoside 2-deoxyribosyltransferase
VRIFLAAPFTQYLEPGEGRIVPALCEALRAVAELLRARGFDVFLAHEREQWGGDVYAPERCTPLDWAELRRADVVVAFPRKSGGVHVELGWASALSKPIVIVLEPAGGDSPLVTGLGMVTRVELIRSPALLEAAVAGVLVDHVAAAVRALAGDAPAATNGHRVRSQLNYDYVAG